MLMKIRNVFSIMLCFFMAGCVSVMQGSKAESEAHDFMIRAAAYENAKAYPEALQEYGQVAKRYSSTSYYKRAVWKLAILNIYPENPEINDTASRDWMQAYLKLTLSPGEKQVAVSFVSLLEKNQSLKAELSNINNQKDKIASVAQKRSKELEAGDQRVKELETELAHSYDELQKMKAVDVQMHQSRANNNTGKSSPLIQKAPEPEKNTGKKERPGRRNVPEKAKEYYPYAIQVGSYQDEKDALQEAKILREKGDPVCVSHARIAGKGDWYRVIVGFYRTPQNAQKAVMELKQREYRNAFVIRRPFTIEIGVFPGDEKLKNIETQLLTNGYSAYTFPSRDADHKFRLLVGAFYTENEAETVTKNLQKEGLKPKVVRR
jgi:cell division septation protein DedD